MDSENAREKPIPVPINSYTPLLACSASLNRSKMACDTADGSHFNAGNITPLHLGLTCRRDSMQLCLWSERMVLLMRSRV